MYVFYVRVINAQLLPFAGRVISGEVFDKTQVKRHFNFLTQFDEVKSR